MIVRIESLDDPRVAEYRNMRDRTLSGESLFIAEGVLLIERLVASRYDVASVLSTAAQAPRLSEILPEDVPLYVVDDAARLKEIVGFPYHRGALAVGRRHDPPSLDDVLGQAVTKPFSRVVVCPEITTPDNLGLIARSVAALGGDAILLGPKCCDPLSRRVLRLSMGAALTLPIVVCDRIEDDLRRLRSAFGYATVGTVLDESATAVASFTWPARSAILMGHEFRGLSDEHLALCDHRVTLAMHAETDSLNVGVAASVFLHESLRGAS